MSHPLFQVALELEREGSRLYTELSGEARGAGGRRAFLFLARQEQDHILRIEREIERCVGRREPLPPDTPERVAQFRAKLLTALQEVTERTRAAVIENTDQMRSLEISARMEDFLCCFYREAASETEAQDSKEFFLMMLRMERAHLNLLQGYMAHLEETGYLPTDETWKAHIAP